MFPDVTGQQAVGGCRWGCEMAQQPFGSHRIPFPTGCICLGDPALEYGSYQDAKDGNSLGFPAFPPLDTDKMLGFWEWVKSWTQGWSYRAAPWKCRSQALSPVKSGCTPSWSSDGSLYLLPETPPGGAKVGNMLGRPWAWPLRCISLGTSPQA